MDTKTEQTTNRLKVTVENVKTMFGRKSGTFTAHLGETGWKASGTCKQGALDQLFADLKNANQNELRRKYVVKGAAVFVLYYAGGWWYDIVRADGSYSSCGILSNTYTDALSRMMSHVEQHDGI